MKRNLLQSVAVLSAIDINTYATTVARVGNVIDRLGYDSAIVAVQ